MLHPKPPTIRSSRLGWYPGVHDTERSAEEPCAGKPASTVLEQRRGERSPRRLQQLDGSPAQYAAIDAGIRVVQFIRNKCLRAWMDRQPEGKNGEAMSAYSAVLAKEFAFAGRLGSQARQA